MSRAILVSVLNASAPKTSAASTALGMNIIGRPPLAVATVPADAILKNCRRFGCWGDDMVVSSAFYSCENDVGTAWADFYTVSVFS
jgi:hypothetical protein